MDPDDLSCPAPDSFDIFNRDGFVLRKLEGLAPLLQWMIWIGAAMLIVLLSPKGVPKEFVYFQF